jgi:thiol:disulfide interchange protein
MLRLPLFADMGIPVFTPDWSQTPPLIFVAVGLCASCFIGFGGIWAIRHPRPMLGLLLLVPGGFCVFIGVLQAVHRELFGTLCLVPGIPMIGLSVWLLAQKKAFVGKSLILLVLAVASAIGGISALNFVTWNDPREEYRKRSRETRKSFLWDGVDQKSASPPPVKPGDGP